MSNNKIPCNEDAEAGLLGCCFLDENAWHKAVEAGVNADWFHFVKNRFIWKAMMTCDANGSGPHMQAVLNYIKAKGAEQAGGLAYVATLPDKPPHAGYIEHYLPIIKDKLWRRKAIQAGQTMVHIATERDDIAAAITEVETTVLDLTTTGAEGEDRKGSFNRVVSMLEDAAAGVMSSGMSTGFHSIDRIIGGLRPGSVMTIAARPGLGKSSLVLNMLQFHALKGTPVAIFSMEMTEDELNMRSLGSLASVNMRHALSGGLSQGDISSLVSRVGPLCKSPLHIIDNPDLSITQIRSAARRLVRQHGVKMIAVDYLQLVNAGNLGKGSTRRDQIDTVSRGIKKMAMELKVPVISLSQLNREIERDPGRRPRLSDLRESGSIEQDSDIVGFIYCPDDTLMVGGKVPMKFSVQKNRAGRIGETALDFDGEHTQFIEQSL